MGPRSSTRGSSSSRPRPVGRRFFRRPTVEVARDLLGARLRVDGPAGHVEARLVETEAYLTDDPASHAFRGPTRRNRSMFGPPGTLYVFRIHQVVCANLVTRPGEAVLLRAGVVEGMPPGHARGPGRLARALGLTIADDGQGAVTGPRVRVLARPGPRPLTDVGPRVGIRRAAERPLRFAIRDEPAVSRPRPLTSAFSTRTRAGSRSRQSRTRRRPASGGGRSGGRIAGR